VLALHALINAATGGAGEGDGGGASAPLTTCQQNGAVLGKAAAPLTRP
jgi:hypothetical protein